MGYQTIDAADVPDRHPVAELRDRWRGIADAGGIAAWSRFDPLDFPHVLPWVLLLRQEEPGDPERLRYVVCGEGCRQIFGYTYQGKLFGEDLPVEAVARRRREFAAVRDGRGPLFSASPLPLHGREFIDVYRGVFALSSAEGVVDRYLVVLAPQNIRVAESVSNSRRNDVPLLAGRAQRH